MFIYTPTGRRDHASLGRLAKRNGTASSWGPARYKPKLEAVVTIDDRRFDSSSSAAAIMRLGGGSIPDFACRNLGVPPARDQSPARVPSAHFDLAQPRPLPIMRVSGGPMRVLLAVVFGLMATAANAGSCQFIAGRTYCDKR